MTRNKAIVMSACAVLAAGWLAAAPSSAVPSLNADGADGRLAPAVFCQATITKAKNVEEAGSVKGKRALLAHKGAKVSFTVKVEPKSCNGRSIRLVVGGKTAKVAKFKKSKVVLSMPAKRAKKTGRVPISLKFGTSKQDYTVWYTTSSLKVEPKAVEIYLRNGVGVTSTLKWKGPFTTPQIHFYQGTQVGFSSDAARETLSTTGKQGSYSAQVTTWLQASSYNEILNAVGTYKLNVGFTPTMNSPVVAKTQLDVVVKNNLLTAAEGTMLAPGKYTWKTGQNLSCYVEVTGLRNYAKTGEGTDYFSSAEVTAGIDILPTDTKVEFRLCASGPERIG
jgi:hypothetical protein